MSKEERNFKTLLIVVTALLFVIFGSIFNSCTSYNPSLYPSYDVLNPGESVTENPVGWVYWSESKQEFIIVFEKGITLRKDENYVIINEAMSQWIAELKEALRKERER